ncbi:MAG: YlbF family regulator [Chloroflexi bacterium]|nr:MAG: YlbF family regulator [Chloroflexota bacterium]
MSPTTPPASSAATTDTYTELSAAIRSFAQALAESEQFRAFEDAADRFRHDKAAQDALKAFQEKRQSLQGLLMLNAVSPEDRAELQRLYQDFIDQPSAAAYLQAQDDLMALCRATAELLSTRLGLDFAAACGSGCC